MELIDQISIPISEIFLVRRTRQENVTSLSTHNLIQINREACYSDGVLITVEYFCLIYCMKGSCRLITKRSEREMKRGELFILPPGSAVLCSKYARRFSDNDYLSLKFISEKFSCSDLSE